ncbi:MAG TPA: hypothetical protein VKS81_12025 [Bacteroidota bacterium]|nr:hypothetical protein [Bacteroidota bacterium]
MKRKTKILIVCAIVILAIPAAGIIWFMLNLGPHGPGNIQLYHTHLTKKKVYERIKEFYSENQGSQVPEEFSAWKIPWKIEANDNLNRANPMNADTVNFFFYLPNRKGIIWSDFSGEEGGWNTDNDCILALIGLSGPERYLYNDDLSSDQIKGLRGYFENEILAKIKGVTFEPTGQHN